MQIWQIYNDLLEYRKTEYYDNDQSRIEFKTGIEEVGQVILKHSNQSNVQLSTLLTQLPVQSANTTAVIQKFADLLNNNPNDDSVAPAILLVIRGLQEEISEYEKNPIRSSTTALIPQMHRVHPLKGPKPWRVKLMMALEMLASFIPGAFLPPSWKGVGIVALFGIDIISGVIIWKRTGTWMTPATYLLANKFPQIMGYPPVNINTPQPNSTNQITYGTYTDLSNTDVGRPNPKNDPGNDVNNNFNNNSATEVLIPIPQNSDGKKEVRKEEDDVIGESMLKTI